MACAFNRLDIATCEASGSINSDTRIPASRIALEVKPDQVTFVPERRQEVTTEGGLDAVGLETSLAGKIKSIREAGILVSLFIDPDASQVAMSSRLKAHAIEIHTGAYCDAPTGPARQAQFDKIAAAVKQAHGLGLIVHAGHGLDYHNVGPIAALEHVDELNIGHSIISRAIFSGLAAAVREMAELIKR
jgi:pyridoxine 5-phosphate synthase